MNDLLIGLEAVLSWQPLLFMLVGVVGGIAVGAIPGLTATMTIAVLLPFTFALDPLPGVCFLLGIYSGAVYAGSIPAILLRIPGTPSSAATLLDGYPMALKGKAGQALTISLLASGFGGLIGGVLLLALAPVLAGFALSFGPAEVLQTHSPVNMRVRAVSVYSHLWTVTLPTVRPFSTNSCASRSVVGEIGASVVVAVVRMRP